MKKTGSRFFFSKHSIDFLLPKKGVIFLESFTEKFSSAYFLFIFEIFGKITRIFFLPCKKKKKIVGWIEFSRKINAKKAEIFFRKFSFYAPSPWNLLKIHYLKSFNWEKLVFCTKKTIF
mmetsp:Transcript_42596/g.85275  ORF Transcript_42596/g.85275 Transcript_42596/m.85275 type:complete len:119 (+) Transcript_42596:1207-1563(+)